MAVQNTTYITCRNGHQQKAVAGLKFCIHCGTPIDNPSAQPQQQNNQQQTPPVQPQQAQNNQPPVNDNQQQIQPNQQVQNNQQAQQNQQIQQHQQPRVQNNQPPVQNNQQQFQPNQQHFQQGQNNQQQFQQNQNNQSHQQGGVNPFGATPQQQQNPNHQQGNQNYPQNNQPNNQSYQQGNPNQQPNNQNFQQQNNQYPQQGNPNYQQGNQHPQQNNQQQFQQQNQQQLQQQQQYQQNYQQGNPQQLQQYQQPIQAMSCYTCGGYGQGLSEKTLVCKECGWLRPLLPGYKIDSSSFEWAADGKAMAALRAITPLTMVAQAVSEKVGRRWIESTFNGVLLGEKQLPHIYGLAVRAARILGMSHMPDIYLSGERSWDCLTFGTDKDSFVVIGSALAGNYQGEDMLFLLAREMGHCRAGHALWKTVIRFFLGEQSQSKGMLAGGIFKAILNPTALVTGAIEVPLLAWARQAEITADRAGILAVGNEDVVRRVLLSWSLKSMVMYRQINIEAWLEQQSLEDDGYSKLSELTTSSTPYLGPRLKLLSDFARSQELLYWRKMVVNALRQAAPPPPPQPAPVPYNPPPSSAALPKNIIPVKTATPAPKPAAPAKLAADKDFIRLKCAECQTPMKVPQKALAGKTELPVKCPNKACGKVTHLKKSVKPAAKAAPPVQPKKEEENMNYDD